MAIEIVIPVVEDAARQALTLAPAARLTPDGMIGLVDNGKFRAREILVAVADRMVAAGLAGSYAVHTKPSASRPIGSEDHAELAARSRLVLTGVGD